MAVEGLVASRVPAASGAPADANIEWKGLKRNAIGYLSNLVIGVASTAPAYSLAATLGVIVLVNGIGRQAPAVLLVSFVPMLLIAGAYRALNRADPDAGTTFAWTTRAFGPWVGWINGWAIFLADVIVMASLAQIAGKYTFLLFSWHSAANSRLAVLLVAVVWIAVMTLICYRGIELSARTQQILLGAEIAILSLFAIVALAKVYGGHPAHSIKPEFSWFNPFTLGITPLLDGVLLGVFIYWGWDSGVAVNEESEDPNEGPGRAAVMSTILLLLIYLVVSTAAQAYHGAAFLGEHESDVLGALGGPVLGSGFDKLLIIAVLTSAAASTQTTILPTARTTLSMAFWKAIPDAFGKVHKRYLTPSVSTLGMGGVSILFTIAVLLSSEHVLFDTIIAIGFPICFYYGFTGFASAVYYRHELLNSVRDFVLLGLAPLLGGLMLFAVGGYAAVHYGHAANVFSKPILGITMPIWLGIGGLVLGLVLMIVARFYHREYFSRKLETAPRGIFERPVERAPAHF
jgi:amino acid transporter